jgi:hypothetical protein
VRQAEACHADEPVDVRVEDRVLVALVRLVVRVAAEREAGVVEEDVQAAELRDRLLDESFRARRVGDVEREPDVRFQPVGPCLLYTI